MTDWDARFRAMATFVAGWSKDPREQVGCVLVSPDKRRFSVGYNGLPKGFPDDIVMSRDDKNKYSLHAEDNAIAQAGTDLTGWTVYCTKAPCLRCMLTIHRAGIARVVSAGIRDDSNWRFDQKEAYEFGVANALVLEYSSAPNVDQAQQGN